MVQFFFEATETQEQDLSDDEGDIEPGFWTGNPNRKLWKASCNRAALSVRSQTGNNVYTTTDTPRS
jgi:hypothetical protein